MLPPTRNSLRSGLENMHHLASELDRKESGQPSNVWRHFKHWCAANGENFESEEAFTKFGKRSRDERPQRSAYRGPEGEEFLYWWKDLDRWVDRGYMVVRETTFTKEDGGVTTISVFTDGQESHERWLAYAYEHAIQYGDIAGWSDPGDKAGRHVSMVRNVAESGKRIITVR